MIYPRRLPLIPRHLSPIVHVEEPAVSIRYTVYTCYTNTSRVSSKYINLPVQCFNIVSGRCAVSNLDLTTIQKFNQILTIYRTCWSEPFRHNPITLPHGLSTEEIQELESVYFTLTLILNDISMGNLEKKRIYSMQI